MFNLTDKFRYFIFTFSLLIGAALLFPEMAGSSMRGFIKAEPSSHYNQTNKVTEASKARNTLTKSDLKATAQIKYAVEAGNALLYSPEMIGTPSIDLRWQKVKEEVGKAEIWQKSIWAIRVRSFAQAVKALGMSHTNFEEFIKELSNRTRPERVSSDEWYDFLEDPPVDKATQAKKPSYSVFALNNSDILLEEKKQKKVQAEQTVGFPSHEPAADLTTYFNQIRGDYRLKLLP